MLLLYSDNKLKHFLQSVFFILGFILGAQIVMCLVFMYCCQNQFEIGPVQNDI